MKIEQGQRGASPCKDRLRVEGRQRHGLLYLTFDFVRFGRLGKMATWIAFADLGT